MGACLSASAHSETRARAVRLPRVGPRGTLLSLAVELLERVVAQLDTRTQYALLFTCRDLSAVAQAALLSDIVVSNPREA